MDVLKHAGLDTLWLENNTGSKRVSDRIETIDLIDNQNPNCDDGECYDQVLVDALAKRIDSFDNNTIVVLHMLGSHGPAYYRRYPADQDVFKPSCGTANFSECSQQEIINAYDNTIHYTDKILSEVIDLLKSKQDQFASSMVSQAKVILYFLACKSISVMLARFTLSPNTVCIMYYDFNPKFKINFNKYIAIIKYCYCVLFLCFVKN